MGGSTKVHDTTPKTTAALRDPVVDWLKGGTGAMGQGGAQGTMFSTRPRIGGMTMTGQPIPAMGPTGVMQGGPQPNMDPSGMVGGLQTGGATPGVAGGGYPGMGGQGGFGVGTPGGNPFDRMFATPQQGPGQVVIPNQGDVAGYGRDQIRDVNAPMIGQAPGAQLPEFMRNQIRDVSGGGTQSVDQLGGANSAFFKNMMANLQPAFTQQRTLGLAGAKEQAGNLTGSGFAQTLGAASNRSLGDEQARLADYAVQGMGMEMNRQQGDANRGLQAGMANQGADQGFLNTLLQRHQLGQQGDMANQNASLQALLANQEADQNFQNTDLQRRISNQGAQIGQGQFQGNLDQQRMIQEYQTRAQMGDANANRFLQMLLAQSTAGVGPSTVVRTPGLGEQLLSAGTQLGAAALGGCWVAEELYGEDDPRTHAARQFVRTHESSFIEAYRKRGRKWAAAVRRNPWVKSIIQPLWDDMAREAA